jgi:hypothetical protein
LTVGKVLSGVTWVACFILMSPTAYSQGEQNFVRPKEPKRQDPPQPERLNTPFPVKGIRSFYGSATVNTGIFTEMHVSPDPKEKEEKVDQKFGLNAEGVVGWGPLFFEGISFLTHYRYAQEWMSDYDQLGRFTNSWLGTPQASTFLFPTKAMVRTHEWASDLRFTVPDPLWGASLSVGSQFLLSAGRTGSAALGENYEVAETIWVMENMAPYVQLRLGNHMRSQLLVPFRTFMDRTDSARSYSTYSWSSAGRGKLASFVLKNEVVFPDISSRLFVDFKYYQLKYSSLTLDRNRPGFSFAFDFPVFGDFRMRAKGAYDLDLFYLPKVRIPSFRQGEFSEEPEAAKEYDRRDVRYSAGLSAYFDFGEEQSHRLFVNSSYTQIISTIEEYNGSAMSVLGGYQWSFSGANAVARRTLRFQEGAYAAEF